MRTLNVSANLTLCCLFFIQSPVFASNPESEIRSRWDAFIEFWEAGNAQACAGFYLKDALNIPPGMPENYGREEIQDFYAFLFDNYKSSTYLHSTNSLISCGNTAIEYGNFSVEWLKHDEQVWVYEARCMVHWEKAADGIWYIRTFLFNNPETAE